MSGTDKFSAFFWHRSQDPERLFCRRCPGPTPCPTLLPPSASLQCSVCRPPASFLLTAPQSHRRIVPRDPDLSASPHLPHALPPQATGTARRAKRSPGLVSAPALWGESPSPQPPPPDSPPPRNNPAPLSGTRTVGCGWGGVRRWGKVSAFKEGGRPAPGTSPCPESFPSGAMECARGGRGGREGVGWG